MRQSLSSLAVLLAAACGTRTAPYVDPPPNPGVDAGPIDGGTHVAVDAARDAGTDAGGPDGGILSVDCGRSVQFTSPRREKMLEAVVVSSSEIVEQGWTLLSMPPGASPIVTPGADPATVIIAPDVEGDFLLRFDAMDSDGRAATCEVNVRSVVGPPIALCPEEELRTTIGEPLVITGDGYDDEMVVVYQWELITVPEGASPSLVGADTPVVQLTATTLGLYVLRLTVLDAHMAMDSCDVLVGVTGPPQVTCPPSPVLAPTRQPVTLTASATDDVGIATRSWQVLDRPAGSRATPVPPNADTTRLTPDRQGEYELRYTANDEEGLQASCDVTVIGTPTPPDLTCPARVTTAPLTAVTITATASDDGTIVRWRWTSTDHPAGSAAGAPTPNDAASTRFRPDVAGIYTLMVEATDDDGMTATCVTRVEAGNADGLRVEMFWDTDSTDMDLHLMNPDGSEWTSSHDCYYGNCNTFGSGAPILDWYGPDDIDDPRLDIDDTNGFGPENINITRPEPGTYRVGVHNFRGLGPNGVTVRIYCGGSTTTPRRTFGPVNLRGGGVSSSRNDFWRVADVTITSSGNCTIRDLSRAEGNPWIEIYSSARHRR